MVCSNENYAMHMKNHHPFMTWEERGKVALKADEFEAEEERNVQEIEINPNELHFDEFDAEEGRITEQEMEKKKRLRPLDNDQENEESHGKDKEFYLNELPLDDQEMNLEAT
ncbi:hypothetical protein LIER_09474 [Lithospermum erythrorhizon]|uniref:Uncharacterized protein n=1 Tax=Lithospermum erythrorhizon TaxID=34254 RepID=A0AAV3PHR4_LITER